MTNFTTDRFNFEVEMKNLQYTNNNGDIIDLPKHKAIVNTKTDETLSVMTSQYNLFSNSRFCDLAERIQDTLGLDLDHYHSHKSGRKVLAAFKNPENKNFKLLGYEFTNNIVLFDSRDGSTTLGLAGIGTLHRCSNMFTSIRKNKSSFKIYHNSSLDEMVGQFELALELYAIDMESNMERLERLNDVKVTQNDLYNLIGGWAQLTPEEVRDVAYGTHKGQEVSTRKSNIINGLVGSWGIESAELGQNGFGLWNATTNYFTHKRDKGISEFLFEDAGKKELETIKFVEALA